MSEKRTLNLLGVKCPLNWARAKAALGEMPRGAVLELLVDDPRAGRDIPRAAEMEGHCVVLVEPATAGMRILIER